MEKLGSFINEKFLTTKLGQDVLQYHIFTYMSLEDVLILRLVSKLFLFICQNTIFQDCYEETPKFLRTTKFNTIQIIHNRFNLCQFLDNLNFQDEKELVHIERFFLCDVLEYQLDYIALSLLSRLNGLKKLFLAFDFECDNFEWLNLILRKIPSIYNLSIGSSKKCPISNIEFCHVKSLRLYQWGRSVDIDNCIEFFDNLNLFFDNLNVQKVILTEIQDYHTDLNSDYFLRFFYSGLKNNTNVKILSVNFFGVEVKTEKVIEEFFLNNQTLEKLIIHDSHTRYHIFDESMRKLVKWIYKNKSIVKFKIKGIFWETQTYDSVIEFVKHRKSLVEFKFVNLGIYSKTQIFFLTIVEKMKVLKSLLRKKNLISSYKKLFDMKLYNLFANEKENNQTKNAKIILTKMLE